MSDIKYVLIEMIENDMTKMSGDSIISGIFKGIRVYAPPKEDMLVLVEDRKGGVTYLLNISRFNVLSMQRFDGYTKILHCFRATKEDQEMAISKISDIIEDLRKENRTIEGDDDIIDTSTFTEIPSDVSIIKNITGSNSSTSSGDKSTTYNNYNRNTPAPARSTVNRDPEPKFFKRTKAANKEVLEKMEQRITEIRAGTYQIKLPIIKGDDIEIAAASDDDSDSYDERNFYMHG